MSEPEDREATDYAELAKVKAAITANDPLLKMLGVAHKESEGHPLISRGSFAQYAEDE